MAPALIFDEAGSLSELTDSTTERTDDDSKSDDQIYNLEEDKLEPIAVIGLSLKFPQDATSPDAFWQMLLNKKSAMTEVPKDRYNVDAFYSNGTKKPGTINVRGGHYLREDIAAFDAPFFSIKHTEAASMDPQQRYLLETTFRALENAGIKLEDVAGSDTSVFIGNFLREYEVLILKDPEMEAKYSATGTGTAMLANRLSWFFDLTGPSVALDTACSSSLNALHFACQSLRSRESSIAIVGGCNLFYNPDGMTPLTDLNFLSPDGICYSFDHRANGYSRGEGIGVIVLKPLSDAIRDDNIIRAVIRATGAGQDARTPGITQPSGKAQEKLIRDTYQAGGLDMAHTKYFEAHGTGTQIGDVIEAGAIGAAFRDSRSSSEPLYVGAVKSNIGHLEGASGIAGVIKTILVLEKGIIPPNIWFEQINPKIQPEALKIKFPLEVTPWPIDGLRRASVNSFGFGGSNAHVVLDDAYNYLRLRNIHGKHCTETIRPAVDTPVAPSKAPYPNGTKEPNKSQLRLFTWSAFDETALSLSAAAYRTHLSKLERFVGNDGYLANLAYTLSNKRSKLPWKLFAIASSLDELKAQLEKDTSKLSRSSFASLKVAFIFTGQGAQWWAMGRELLTYGTFQESLEAAGHYFQSLGCKWNLIDELRQDEKYSRINEPVFSQPICTALQIALVSLLRSWGINPSAVVGHSSGEIAAAYAVGGLSKESAWKVAYYRGLLTNRLIRSNQESRTMMSVGLSETEVAPYLEKVCAKCQKGIVAVGCINSPFNVTITGSGAMLDELSRLLEGEDIFVRKLKVDAAYHSEYMREAAPEYEGLLQHLEAGEAPQTDVKMFSSVTGKENTLPELKTGDYWVRNLVSPVRFAEAMKHICTKSSKKKLKKLDGAEKISVDYLVEVGPHAALRGPIREILQSLKSEHIGYSSMLVRNESAVQTSLEVAGQLYCLGYPVKVDLVNKSHEQLSVETLIDLPEYPFNHTKRYWLESRLSKEFRFRKSPRHELLGTSAVDWNPLEARWRNMITLSENPWIQDHQVNSSVLYPAAGMIVMALEAVRKLNESDHQVVGYSLRDVTFNRGMIVPPGPEGIEAQIYLKSATNAASRSSSWCEFRLCSYDNQEWVEHCNGSILICYKDDINGIENSLQDNLVAGYYRRYDDGMKNCKTNLKPKILYENLDKIGLSYGPTFQVLRDIYFNEDGEATASLCLHDWMSKITENRIQPHVIHPTALDGILQLMFPALSQGGKRKLPTMVPTRISKLWISGCGSGVLNDIKVYTKSSFQGLREASSSIIGIDEKNSKPYITLEGFQVTAVANHNSHSRDQQVGKQLCYNIDWKPDLDFLDNQKVEAYCASGVTETLQLSELKFEDKELFCFLSISKALKDMTQQSTPSVKPHLKRYLEWIKYKLQRYDEGILLFGQPEWTTYLGNEDYWRGLLETIGNVDPEGCLIAKVGKNLSAILGGEVDALDLFFRDGDNIMEEYYSKLQLGDYVLAKLAKFIHCLAHKNPSLKVLEIGAGTGASTRHILEILSSTSNGLSSDPRFTEYLFTDISPGFFEKAREQFGAYTTKGLAFSVLDIEKDPLLQGFQAESYDLIIAMNVLHATRSLSKSVQNARKLLKAGGKLVLCEVTQPQPMRTSFIFGLLSGWWLSTEDIRRWGPLVTEKEWHQILCENQFSGVDFAFRDTEDMRYQTCSVMISTATAPEKPQYAVPKATILIKRHSALQLKIAEVLRDRLNSLGSADCQVYDIEELEQLDLAERICVFMPELDGSFLLDMSPDLYMSFKKLISSTRGLLWLTKSEARFSENPLGSMVRGLANTLRGEIPHFKFTILALEDVSTIHHAIDNVAQAFQGILPPASEDFEVEYHEQDGWLCIGRAIEANHLNDKISRQTTQQDPELGNFGQVPPRPLTLSIGSPGLLETLEFTDDKKVLLPLASDEVEVKVAASGLNFRDVLTALGQISDDYFGIECAGIISRIGDGNIHVKVGDRVCCWLKGSFKTFGRCSSATVVKIPDDLPLCSAAAIPVIYTTAYYSLVHTARIKQGDSILIHSAAGGTGQALIQIAKLYKAEIYVTVGTVEKKQFLMNLYGIPEDRIFSSRSLNFSQGIRMLRGGQGVDIVVNTLAGEGLRASWECVSPFGRFIELGKKDIYSNSSLPMASFARNVMFAAVDLAHILEADPHLMGELMRDVMTLFKQGQICVPEPLRIYNISQLSEAFRYMQSGKNLGKIVINFQEDDLVPITPSTIPSYYFDPEATYLISGGLGGIGRSTVKWMVERRAKHFILLSRSTNRSATVSMFLEEMKRKGTVIAALPCDVSDEKSLASVLRDCSTMPPIKGCIQGSVVVRDGIFETMSLEDFNAAIKPKVQGSWNLHNLLPKNLDFFVLLSSLSGVVGSRGQANYACGNTYQDALARYRVANGQKAAVIDLGMVLDVGFVAERENLENTLRTQGHSGIQETELHAVLEYYLDPRLPVLSPLHSQVLIGIATPASLRSKNIEEPYWLRRPTFRYLHQIGRFDGSASTSNTHSTIDIKSMLTGAESLAEAGDVVRNALVAKLSRMLALPKEDIDPTKPLHTYGVDSLVAVEIRNWFDKEIGTDVAVFEVLGNKSLGDLGLVAAGRSRYQQGSWTAKESRE